MCIYKKVERKDRGLNVDQSQIHRDQLEAQKCSLSQITFLIGLDTWHVYSTEQGFSFEPLWDCLQQARSGKKEMLYSNTDI